MASPFYFTQADVRRLETQAEQLREDIVSMIHEAGAGHPGGSLSAVDMITALYFHVMNIDPKNPRWEDRDRFALSKGHSCPELYLNSKYIASGMADSYIRPRVEICPLFEAGYIAIGYNKNRYLSQIASDFIQMSLRRFREEEG